MFETDEHGINKWAKEFRLIPAGGGNMMHEDKQMRLSGMGTE